MNRYIIPILLATCASLACRFAFGQPPPDLTRGVSITLGATNQENSIRLLDGGPKTKTCAANIEVQ